MNEQEYVQELVNRCQVAQEVFATYTQEQVDTVVKAIGKAIFDHAKELGEIAAEETGMGNAKAKELKNRNKSMAVWQHLKGKKSIGIIRVLEDEGIVEVAKPMGVVGCITPSTNPTMTPMHNAMVALKGQNALLICPHPHGKISGCKTVEYMRQALREVGAPEDLIIIIPEPTMTLSAMVMKMCDTSIATGGGGMVKVAYQSGKPALGVGAGNVQCLVDRDANLKEIAPKIISGRSSDNGILCTCEQSVICPRESCEELAEELEENGAYYVSRTDEITRLTDTIFPDGEHANRVVIGRPATEIAQLAGITVPEDTKVLLIKADGMQQVLGHEKLFPVLSLFSYDSWEEGIELVNQNLSLDGRGHSIVIHSYDQAHIEQAAKSVPVSRFLINGIGSSGLGGAFTNSLAPTGTLGCGSWGNNSVSENMTYTHLINISRIAYTNPNAHIPTPEEVWA